MLELLDSIELNRMQFECLGMYSMFDIIFELLWMDYSINFSRWSTKETTFSVVNVIFATTVIGNI